MKFITLLLSAFFCISVSNAQKKPLENQKNQRIEKIINSQWTFNYFPNETADKGYESPGFDDSKWPAISLPHTWSTYETSGELHPFIRQGNEKNAGEEMNWLNWIPSGGTVVIFQEGANVAGLKGAIVTNKSELADLIALVHPGFVNFSEEAKERALIFISKMNPYIHANYISEQSREGDQKKITKVSYTAGKGQPILIPLLKFINE